MAAPSTPKSTSSKDAFLIQEAIYDYKRLQNSLKPELTVAQRKSILDQIKALTERYPALIK